MAQVACPLKVTIRDVHLDGSNASAIDGMSSLVTASRQFEMLTKVIEAFSTIDHKAPTDVMARR